MSHAASPAFLALWNSISSPQVAREYENWHTFEHVPERVGLPGFIEARRYRAIQNPMRYFTCYSITSLDALATPEYRDVFTHPTPWSARIRLEMRDFFRMPCELGGAFGNSSASRLVTLHLRSASSGLGAQLNSLLQHMVNDAGLVCAQWGLAHPADDFPLANVTFATPQSGQDFVVMLQHLDQTTLNQSTQTLLQRLAELATPVTEPACLELLTQVRQDELNGSLASRQPARPELLKKFTEGDSL